jgi:hypothetical protein
MQLANHPVVNTGKLSILQINQFEETGLLHLSSAIPDIVAQAMCERLWDEIERKYGFRRGAPQTWQSAG